MELGFTVKTSLHSGKGYTLTELMLTVIIIGILASYATFLYQDMVRGAKITEAALAAKEVRQSIEAHVAIKRELPNGFTRSMAGVNSSVIDKIETIRISDTDIQVNVFLKKAVFPDESEQQVYTLLGNLVTATGTVAWHPCGDDNCITPVSKLPTAGTLPPPIVGPGGIVIAPGPTPGPTTPGPATPGPATPGPATPGSSDSCSSDSWSSDSWASDSRADNSCTTASSTSSAATTATATAAATAAATTAATAATAAATAGTCDEQVPNVSVQGRIRLYAWSQP